MGTTTAQTVIATHAKYVINLYASDSQEMLVSVSKYVAHFSGVAPSQKKSVHCMKRSVPVTAEIPTRRYASQRWICECHSNVWASGKVEIANAIGVQDVKDMERGPCDSAVGHKMGPLTTYCVAVLGSCTGLYCVAVRRNPTAHASP